MLDKIAKTGQNLAGLMLKGYQLEKSTPPPVVAVVTNMSYASMGHNHNRTKMFYHGKSATYVLPVIMAA